VLYVDDFLLSGPEDNLAPMWGKIGKALNIDEPAPMSLYLGCIHEEGQEEIDGHIVRTMTFNQEGFFLDKIDKHMELCMEKGGAEAKLSTVTTPYIKEQAKENCARRPECEGLEHVQCSWCKHAFALPSAKEVLLSNGKLIHCPWCELL
jgi:hypothetical protein